MRLGCKLLAVVLAGLVFASAAPAQTKLRYKFKEGDKLVCAVDMDQKSATKLLGNDIDMTMKLAIELSWQTLKVDDKGNANAKVTVSHVKLKVAGGPLGTIEIDSKEKNQEENIFGKMFAGMVKGIAGMEMTLTVSPTGDVTDAKVVQGKGGAKMPAFGGLGGDMFNADTMKSTVVGSIIIPLPKEPVSKDKSWSQKSEEKTGMGKIITNTKFTYVGNVEKGGKKLVKLTVNQPDMKIEPGENAKLKINLKKGSANGYLLFDNDLGRVVQVTTDTRMQMEIEAAGATADVDSTQTTAIRIHSAGETGAKSNPSPEKK